MFNQNEFGNHQSNLAETLDALVEAELLLRAGVTKLVIVHHKKVRPWLIHSSKLLRLDKEKLNPTDGKVLALPDDKGTLSTSFLLLNEFCLFTYLFCMNFCCR